ncbi:glycoside hydrolase family 3 protein [Undibacterium fentianense]|uniref:Exo 1,3/1,4-beta-D-glucan glucohydrolase n=1 Tax=Undibacterium fentianense TaxID=2828728 RepID=A0A941E3S0_9BURK|nr:glycoside hydrolase family 3 protein [Undibacterium fentianense]MBR7800562.1 exo 1,3/1,4-beta-D-glucan glucohydrolase [Undibacterium fentianense]
MKINLTPPQGFTLSAAIALTFSIASLPLASSAVQAAPSAKVYKDWPHIKSAIAKDPALEAKIKSIVSQMTLAQKVGQMTQAEIKFITPDDVRKYYLGSVLNGGGSWPGMNKYAKAADWVALADQYYDASMRTDMVTKVPVIWGIDAIHGNSNVVGATLFPHNIGLGAARNPKLVGQMAEQVGKAVRATGIAWVFAPTLAVGRDARWGRSYESFAEDGHLVKEYGAVYVKALQGQFKDDKNVVATAKHFIGDGGTFKGVDRGVNQASLSEMINQHAQGYYGAFAAGAQTVMASYNSWHDVETKTNYGKMHGSKALLTDALKDKMGFDGFVVSDWDGIAEVPGCSNDSCAQAINAGIDMVMVPDNWKSFIANTIAQVERGEIPMARIDDAVSRILRVKLRANLFGKKPSQNQYAGKQEALLARDIARQAVRESLVLIKNNQQVLPLQRGKKILVVGKNADSMINQSGGWSITWQGTENKEGDYTPGDTILTGIKEAAGAINVHYSAQADDVDLAQFDVVLAVLGETPYAEGFGDVAASRPLAHSQLFPEDLAVLKKVAGKGKPVVTLMVSGRAVYANDLINLSDSFVAAWLPGTEGKGVADVLFKDAQGKVAHKIKGKLSFSWPAQACLAKNLTSAGQLVQFKYGYGLQYGKTRNMGPLPEDNTSACEMASSLTISSPQDLTSYPLFVTTGKRKVTVGADFGLVNPDDTVTVKSVSVGAVLGKHITWSGKGRFEASAAFPTPIPSNLQADGVLQFDVQVQTPPTARVGMTMDCGEACTTSLNVSSVFSPLVGKGIKRVKIPLSCFTAFGVDLRKVKTPFSISTDGNFAAAFADIKIVGGATKDADTQSCESLK